MASCFRGKGVLETVYVESPTPTRKRAASLNNHDRRSPGDHGGGSSSKAYNNKRAHLLEYSKHLRQSASSSCNFATKPTTTGSDDEPATNQERSSPKRHGKARARMGRLWKNMLRFFSCVHKKKKAKKSDGSWRLNISDEE